MLLAVECYYVDVLLVGGTAVHDDADADDDDALAGSETLLLLLLLGR